MPDSQARSLPLLMQVLWRRRLVVLSVVAAFLLGGAAIAWLKSPVYRASVVMIPRQSDDQGGAFSALLGQVGGLGSLAGLVGLGASDGKDSLALLKSRAFFESFAHERNLLPLLFPTLWDDKAGSWKSSLSPDEVPTYGDAWELFNTRIRTLTQDQKTGIVTMSINWKDPEVAADWANDLATRANERLRQRAIEDSTASLRQLQAQLDRTSVVELQQSIYRLMEIEIKKEVLAKSRRDYAFSVIDPAVVPDIDRYVSPRRALILMSALILGLGAAVAFVIFDEARRLRRRP